MNQQVGAAEIGALSRGVIRWSLGWCVVATLLTWVVFAQYREVDVWGGLKAAKAFENPVASDPVFAQSVFRTRANTWSNLAYAYVGILAVVAAVDDLRRRKRGAYLLQEPAVGIFFGASCIYLGIGSGIFHASLTHWGQQLDVASMYSTLVALIALNMGRLVPRLGGFRAWPLWVAMAVGADVWLYIYKWQVSSIKVLPGLILTVFAFTIADRFLAPLRTHAGWVMGAAAALVLAVGCRALDAVGPLADPSIWLTGHALWHCFTAASLGCIYMYYRKELPVA